MSNEYYGAASTPTEDFLAHYGVKGMKWGVRKAVQSGNMRKLSRQYNKAAKKLAKLEKRAASGKKYAKRAAALGAGAALAGGVAATGTHGIGTVMNKGSKYAGLGIVGVGKAGKAVSGAMKKAGIRGAGKLDAASNAVMKAGVAVRREGRYSGNAVKQFGKNYGAGNRAGNAFDSAVKAVGEDRVNKVLNKVTGKSASDVSKKLRGISNSGYTRLGAAAVGAGLGAGAAYNAYRAATTKRAAKKAAQFRSEMNKAFAGTAYANGRPASQKKKKRR